MKIFILLHALVRQEEKCNELKLAVSSTNSQSTPTQEKMQPFFATYFSHIDNKRVKVLMIL